MNTKLTKAILRAGLVAGTLDWMGAVAVFLLRGGDRPEKVFIYIASGVLGDGANAMEPWIPYLGFILHYFIAYSWTTIFFLAYPRVSLLRSGVVMTAVGYGALIWLVMNLIVLPLSSVQQRPITATSALIGAAVLMVCIGIPLAIHARRYYK